MRVFKKFLTPKHELIIMNLEPEELVLETIVDYLKKNNIPNACVISGIGTLKRLSFHRITTTDKNPSNEYLTLEGPFELSSTQGLIINYEPHLHFVASDLQKTYSGHLEFNSQILYLAEFVLISLSDFNLTRRPNERNIYFIEEV